MKTTFYLMRHGQTIWNQEFRFQGQLDSQLTEQGKIESRNAALALKSKSIDLIASSPLGRAQQTAKICAQTISNPEIMSTVFIDRLVERHLGTWQGQQISALETLPLYQEFFHGYSQAKPEGGESAIECATRMYQSLTELAKDYVGKNILVITHGEAMRCLLAKLGLIHQNNAYQAVTNGQLFKVTFCHQEQDLKYINLPTVA